MCKSSINFIKFAVLNKASNDPNRILTDIIILNLNKTKLVKIKFVESEPELYFKRFLLAALTLIFDLLNFYISLDELQFSI